MPIREGTKIPTIDCVLVVLRKKSDPSNGLGIKTQTKVAVTAQTETQDANKLIKLGTLLAQKREQVTLTGHTIVLTDNVFSPELAVILQGGKIQYKLDGLGDPTDEIIGYSPPAAGSDEQAAGGEVFFLDCYSAVYDAAGILKKYEVITYPNCQGQPITLDTEDNSFRTPEYTIVSAPETGQKPYEMQWIEPNELPNVVAIGA